MTIASTQVAPAAKRERKLPTLVRHNGAVLLVSQTRQNINRAPSIPSPSYRPWEAPPLIYSAVYLDGPDVGQIVDFYPEQLDTTPDFVGTVTLTGE